MPFPPTAVLVDKAEQSCVQGTQILISFRFNRFVVKSVNCIDSIKLHLVSQFTNTSNNLVPEENKTQTPRR